MLYEFCLYSPVKLLKYNYKLSYVKMSTFPNFSELFATFHCKVELSRKVPTFHENLKPYTRIRSNEKCYTLFYNGDATNKFQFKPVVAFKYKFDKPNMISRDLCILFTIHSSKEKIDPDRQGFLLLRPGHAYDIIIRQKWVTNLLPPPFKTNCKNYIGDVGSHKECIDK